MAKFYEVCSCATGTVWCRCAPSGACAQPGGGGSGAPGWSTVPDTTRRGRPFGLAVDHPDTLFPDPPAGRSDGIIPPVNRPVLLGSLAVVLIAAMALAACGSGSTATTATTGARTTVANSTSLTRAASSASTQAQTTVTTVKDPVVVGLGNSVPSGTACSCVNFVSA